MPPAVSTTAVTLDYCIVDVVSNRFVASLNPPTVTHTEMVHLLAPVCGVRVADTVAFGIWAPDPGKQHP